jgi:ribosomal protein S27E
MIHTHVAARAIDEARRRILTRRCPECRLEQLTAEGSVNDPVPCENCGTFIPPKGAEEGGS